MIDFNSMMDNYLHRESFPKQIGRYYPSEIGTCMRKVWYSYKFPSEVEPELLKIFEVGNIMHDLVVKVLSSEKNPDIMLVSAELPFKKEVDDFLISGRIDNIILVKASGKNVLIEVKSTGAVDFVNEPAPHNAMQLQLYMHVMNIHDGILLYLDKKNLKSKVFRVEYSEAEAEKILNRFRALHKLLKMDAMPDPEARSSKAEIWMCRNCEHREKCYKETPSSARWL